MRRKCLIYEYLRQFGVSSPSEGWVCNRCKNKLVAGKLPPFCISNSMQAGVIPAEVCAKLPRTANDSGVIFVHTGGFPGKPDGRWYLVESML